MARRRGFGDVERRVSRSGGVTYRARYAMPDGSRYSRTLATKMVAEAWLAAERALIDRDAWSPPRARQEAVERREHARRRSTARRREAGRHQAVARLVETQRPRRRNRRRLRRALSVRAVPAAEHRQRLSATPRLAHPADVRDSAPPREEELIERASPKIRRASTARVKREAKPATFCELAILIDNMPQRLKLFIVLAAFICLREGEALELRRSDVDERTGRIDVSREVDKNARRDPRRLFRPRPSDHRPEDSQRDPDRARAPTIPADASAAPAGAHRARPTGLLLPGDRTDHMSVRYLMDRYRPAREAAGRPELTIHHLRHTALTLAGQHGATAAELQARARPCLPDSNGDLPARHPRSPQVARGEDRGDVRGVAREPTVALRGGRLARAL